MAGSPIEFGTPCARSECARPMVPSTYKGKPFGMRRHQARGLCQSCYAIEFKAGRIDQWQHPGKAAQPCATCEDALWLYETGEDPEKWAARLFTTNIALARLLGRHGQRELARCVYRVIEAERRQRQQLSVVREKVPA